MIVLNVHTSPTADFTHYIILILNFGTRETGEHSLSPQVEFPTGSFDAIFCSAALPFVVDIPHALERWRHWLRECLLALNNVISALTSISF